MKSNAFKVLLPFVILAGGIAVMVMMIMSKQPPEKKVEEDKGFLVNTTEVKREDVRFNVKTQGTLLPVTNTNLVAQVSGVVVSVSDIFTEGGFFAKGDILVELEQADYVTDLKLAEAELQRAKAALEEEQARGKVAAEEWRTVKSTVPTALGLRKPQLATAQANLRAAEAQYERAQRNLERTKIRAPFDGLVKSRSVDLGQFVTMGTALGNVYATNIAEVRLPLSDHELGQLNLHQDDAPRSVTLSATVGGKPQQWQAKLVRNEGVFDQSSRVIYVVAELNDPYARSPETQHTPVKFGRFVSAAIEGNSLQDVVKVPRHVLRMDGTLLVTDENRKLMIRDVEVVRTDEDFVYIGSGLSDSDYIVTSAVPNPIEGLLLRFPGDEPAAAQVSAEEVE